MNFETRLSADSERIETVREQDLRENFEKVNEQVQKAIRDAEAEIPWSLVDQAEPDLVIEPVYAYRVNASS